MIIIIEDDEISGRLLIKMLQEYFPKKNHHWLRSVNEAIFYISQYKSSASDLLLIDFYLEDGVAWDILEQIRTKALVFKGKIVLMPGITPNEEENRLIKYYQPFKVLVKPIGLSDLRNVL